MKPSDFPIGATVSTLDPTDQAFAGMIGTVIPRPPARYVWVRFEDDEHDCQGHPFRVDELRIDAMPDKGEDK